MNYQTFKTVIYSLPKDDPKRIAVIKRYPHYAEHNRNMSIKKLMEIRARKKETA